jgi:hypothetical protein
MGFLIGRLCVCADFDRVLFGFGCAFGLCSVVDGVVISLCVSRLSRVLCFGGLDRFPCFGCGRFRPCVDFG